VVYVISYDLRIGASLDDYSRITNAIEALGGRRVLLSQWAVRSNWSSTQVATHLHGFIDGNDRLLVTEINSNWAGYNPMADLNIV
jgi:hypothetical protein